MQILDLVLYNDDGRTRRITFRPGRLNILTGESETGKSAIIEAINYALGADELRVPFGPITQTVSWYAIRLAVGDGHAFLARAAPVGTRRSSASVCLLIGSQVEVPPLSGLEANTNVEGVKDWLTRATGIEANEFVPPRYSTRRPLQASFDHALLFCFQAQDEIANRRLLFHKQGEDFVRQAIRDVLPYFLGVLSGDDLLRRGELQRLKREYRLWEKRREVGVSVAEAQAPEVLGLFAEAANAGLLPAGRVPTTEVSADLALEALREVHSSPRRRIPQSDALNEFIRLQRRKSELSDEYRQLQEEINLVRGLAHADDMYGAELTEQERRLRTIGLLPAEDNADYPCPLCGRAVGHDTPMLADVRTSLEDLARRLREVERDSPRLHGVLQRLEARATDMRREIEEATASLDEMGRHQEQFAEIRAEVDFESYVRGRIAEQLRSLERADKNELVDSRGDTLARQIEDLERELDDSAITSQIESILNLIGRDMSRWASDLDLEYSRYPIRIDAQQLTVIADTESGGVPLERIGSAKNWIGYHLVALLALHKFFVENTRPVPRFLILDQPTQAFYPPDVAPQPDLKGLQDSDRLAVERSFKFLFEVVSELGGAFQVIVTDHANLPQDWFQSSVLEQWRGGARLIPADWI